ncbi:MAG: hypothetical protein KKD18_00170 [Nanoarchaeota archaeon]|nr:hypothetical protein [Nanoarchaeota archaeon]MBU0976813.1 hypothetical protein [Nanoarchaeota archaeon]
MLDRTLIGKASSIAVVLLLFLVLLAFVVAGDEVAGGESAPVQENVASTPPAELVGEPAVEVSDDSSEGFYVPVEEVIEVSDVGDEAVETENVYVDLDEVLSDEGVEEVAEVTDENVYVDIEEVSAGGSSGEEISVVKVASGNEEKTLLKSFDGGKKVLQAEVGESDEEIFWDIERQEEVVRNDESLVKEVVVSSEEHFNEELIYYSDLDVEVDKSQISVKWRNEDKEINFETYDENGNGLVDRISWVIPHLSVQEFEIVIDLTWTEDANSSEILINTISAPGAISASLVAFDFELTYYNLSLVLCNLTIVNNATETVVDSRDGSDEQNYYLSLSNGGYSWNFECFDVSNGTIRTNVYGNFMINANYTPVVKLTANPESLVRGNIVSFGVNVSAPPTSEVNFIKYRLNYGDGNYDTETYAAQTSIVMNLVHNYTSSGSFVANLTGTVQYVGDDSGTVYSISVYKTIVVNEPPSTADTEGPKIHLMEPENGKGFELTSRDQKIEFSYNVTDNVKTANCTFEMFYYNNSVFGEEIITEFKSDITNGSVVSYEYKDFDEGDYSWDVECWDNSSNKGSVADRDFYIEYANEGDSPGSSGTNSEVKSAEEVNEINDVQEVIDAINEFFVKEENFGPDQTDTIRDLEIDETLKFYKKKLLQMKLDLQHNLDYMEDEAKRAERKNEILSEIEQMKKEIPLTFEITDTHEYFKNSLELDFEDVIRAYAEAKGLVVDARVIRDMAAQNELLQNKLAVSTRIKEVSAEYYDGHSAEFVVVAKDIDFKSKGFDSLLEVVPSDVASSDDVSFVVPFTVLREDSPIFQIKLEDLGERETLVYTVRKALDLADIEKTTTLAFKEEVPESTIGGVTGFVSFVGGIGGGGVWFYVSWILAIALLLFLGIYSYKKVQIGRLKKHKDVRTLFAITSETEKLLKRKEIERAREKYNEAKIIYPKIPEHGKRYVYQKLQKLYLAIDKKDIVSMVKEFMAASKEGRKNDALMLYGNIQKLYPRMPSRFKQKVFEKMQPHLDRLRDFKTGAGNLHL